MTARGDAEDKRIQEATGNINRNQRSYMRKKKKKDCEEDLRNDKQPAEINGGDVTCEEWQ